MNNPLICAPRKFAGLFYFCYMTRIVLVIAITFLFAYCSSEGYKKATDAQDAGREFIRASLDGDMKKASFYLLRDSLNEFVFNKFRQHYSELSTEEKRNYREAQIRPVKIHNENDSTVNYTFTNSYKQKDTTVIRVVKVNDEWLVDLKAIHRHRD